MWRSVSCSSCRRSSATRAGIRLRAGSRRCVRPLRGRSVPRSSIGVALVLLTRVFVSVAPRALGANFVYGTLGAIFVGLTWLDLASSRDSASARPGSANGRLPTRKDRSRWPDPRTRLPRQAPWRVPQRRQKRAVAESDRPQLEHGWTARTGAARRLGDDASRRRGPEPSVGVRVPTADEEGHRRRAALGRADSAIADRPAGPARPGPWRLRRAVSAPGAACGRRWRGGGVRGEDPPGRLLDDVSADGLRLWRDGQVGRLGWCGLRSRLGGATSIGSGSDLDRRLGCGLGRDFYRLGNELDHWFRLSLGHGLRPARQPARPLVQPRPRLARARPRSVVR